MTTDYNGDQKRNGTDRIIEGFLKKKSPKKVLGRSVWQERYFVLQSDRLLYFKTDKQAKDLDSFIGIILINNIQSVKERTESSNPQKWRFNLQLIGSTQRIFELFAENATKGQAWMNKLLVALETVNKDTVNMELPKISEKRNTKFWKPAQNKRIMKKRAPVFDHAQDDKSKKESEVKASDRGVSDDDRADVLSSFSSCVAFQGLDLEIQEKVLSIMCKKNIAEGTTVIKKEDRTQTLHFVKSGAFKKIEGNGNVTEVGEAEIFGELDVMYDQPSNVTVTATVPSVCWCLDRYNFKAVLKTFTEDKFRKYKTFLTSTELLSKLNQKQLIAMAEALEESTFTLGQDIVTQGQAGDSFFLLKHGECEVLKDGKKVFHYKEGNFFGERALLENQKRAATVRATTPVTVLSLDRATFVELLGDVDMLRKQIENQNQINAELQKLEKAQGSKPNPQDQKDEGLMNKRVIVKTNNGVVSGVVRYEGKTQFSDGDWLGIELDLPLGKHQGTVQEVQYFTCVHPHGIFCRPDTASLESSADENLKAQLCTSLEEKQVAATQSTSPTSGSFITPSSKPSKIEAFPLDKLRVIGLLGSGSFGRVELREHVDTGYTYALKAINKQSIRENGQLEFIKNERAVLAVLDSPFIVKLHGAMVDTENVYFLLEPAMGGEMFSLLNEHDKFPEDAVRFYAASVVLAFEHMHSQTIVYRDLKPENVMLDHEGYVKITDFGFAKPLTNRTYTFCGTPDYLSPEIVLNQGHGFPTDWWTVGVLMYEMLTGQTPFYDDSTQAMYEKIVAGIFPFPAHVSPDARDLVKRFLVKKPTKRLGVISGGVKLIKEHPFFSGFDWDALMARKLPAPYKRPIKDKYDRGNFSPEEED